MKPMVWLAAAALLITACSERGGRDDLAKTALIGAPTGPVVATVNGEVITEPLLTVFARGRGLDPAIAEQRQQALDTLVETVLLAQDALQSGLAAKSEVQAEVALVRVQQLSGRAIADYRGKLNIGDAEIQALYEQEKQRAGDREYKLEHILFADEAAARAALEQALAPNADFSALMEQYASTAKQARALEWSNVTQMPKEIAEALPQLQDGQVAPVPIQTAFGWHVLRRAESRPFTPPPLEAVREGARRQLTENALKDYVSGLRSKAKIATGVQQP